MASYAFIVNFSGKRVKKTWRDQLHFIRYSPVKILVSFLATEVEAKKKVLTKDTLNPRLISLQYAVRGPIVLRSYALEKELKAGAEKPFTEIIRANLGDCHAMGQKPITYMRQVLALVSFPELMCNPKFPSDMKERANIILENCDGYSVGSYTESQGLEVVRKKIAEYIEKRDGFPSDWKNVILSDGASSSIKGILKLLIFNRNGKKGGVMIPFPQYPLYSATLEEFGLQQIAYFLDEENHWALSVDELERTISEAKKHCDPRAIVVLNPGNPTGHVLSRDNIEDIIKFAHRHHLQILADEVYQDNIYCEESKFYSFKQVINEMGPPYCKIELSSFMSCSKGYFGECGLRGASTELVNYDPFVLNTHLKVLSTSLCPSAIGQAAMYCLANPPKEGEPSYELYMEEKTDILESLKSRALMVEEGFNSMEGFSLNPIKGAMYAFPRLLIPEKAIEKAKALNQTPSEFYCFQLLEKTGICVVPGSGFGEKEGTYHFRSTILPQPKQLISMLGLFRKFHQEFLAEYK